MPKTDEYRTLGYGKKTGVFLTKADFDQLIEVIARGKAKDKLAERVGIKQFGGSGKGMINTPTTGGIGIQTFVRQLAITYKLEDPEFNLYGINKYGEFIKWVPAEDITKGGLN